MTGNQGKLANTNQMNIISQKDLDVTIQPLLKGTSQVAGSKEYSVVLVEVKSL
jgi:hypothetical protein